MKISRLLFKFRCRLIAYSAFAIILFGADTARACTAIVDTTIILTDRRGISRHQTIIVEKTRIARIGEAAVLKPTSGCVQIDGRDRYVIPGLVDTHAHFFGYSRAGAGDPITEQAILRMLLANGVTTAVVMEGTPRLLELKESIAKGRVFGPTLYVAGKLIQAPNTGEPPGRETFQTPADVHREVRDEKRLGYDFIKVHGEMPMETYEELLRTSHLAGMPVVGHVPDNLSIRAALRGGQILIVHAESYLQTYYEFGQKLPAPPVITSMTDEIVRETANASVFVQPTLSVFRQIGDQVADPAAFLRRPEVKLLPRQVTNDWRPGANPYLKRWRPADVERLNAEYAVMQELVGKLALAGVPLLVGTDDMVPMQLPGFSMREEMLELEEAGLTPFQVLQAATYTAARFLHKEGTSGSIAPGMDADLILLTANPLLEVTNSFSRAGVMVRGVWQPEAELQDALWKHRNP